MLITEETIQKFFDQTCTAEEAEAVALYLQENPEAGAVYLSSGWTDQPGEILTDEESGLMLLEIKERLGMRSARIRWIRRTTAIAASLLVALFAGWLFRSQKAQVQIAGNKPMPATEKKWEIKTNLTDQAVKVTLEDKSLVRMQPKATIRYVSFKQERKRDIDLWGESFFKVAKDKTKPFTVYAGGVATTAVGTAFSVAEKNGRVTVKLFEGKVRIAAATKLPGWKQEALYLEPGQEFIYDKMEGLFEVRAIPKAPKAAPGKPEIKTETETMLPMVSTSNWYMFNNQSLGKVFEQLEEIYNVKIVYKATDVRNVYFIGRFEKTDSLDDILNNIALLKKLNIRHTGNTYVITRKK